MSPVQLFELFLSDMLFRFKKDQTTEISTTTDDKFFDSPILIALFHKFIQFYLEKKEILHDLKIDFEFPWILHVFETKYEISFFKIDLETVELLIDHLNKENITCDWLNISELQQYYTKCLKNDRVLATNLKILIMMAVKRKEGDFQDIKHLK